MTIFTGQIYRFPFVSHPDYCLHFSTEKIEAVAKAAITEKTNSFESAFRTGSLNVQISTEAILSIYFTLQISLVVL